MKCLELIGKLYIVARTNIKSVFQKISDRLFHSVLIEDTMESKIMMK